MRNNKKNTIVSVLLSAFNGNTFIEDQVKSIASQNFSGFNIILRDDGSKKVKLDFITNISKKYNVSILIDNGCDKNIGSLKSFNRLLYKAQSEYVCFSDQDDVWNKDKLITTFNRIKLLEDKYGSQTPILVHTDLAVCDNSLRSIHPSFIAYQKLDPSKKSLHYLLVQNNVTGCTMMINRALKEKALPIPKDALVHDWWIALVASSFGIIDFINRATVNYRQHNNNQIGAKKFDLCYLVSRIIEKETIRNEFYASIKQAEVFYKRFKSELTVDQNKILRAFIGIKNENYISRRTTIMKYKLFKQDIFRTLGLIGMV